MQIRDRIKEFRRIPANELLQNPKNWRLHPENQLAALRGVLNEIGFAGAELARETPDGIMLIDGAARKQLMGILPVTFRRALSPISTQYALTRVHDDGVISTIEAVEAVADGNARYIGVRLEPVRKDVAEISSSRAPPRHLKGK